MGLVVDEAGEADADRGDARAVLRVGPQLADDRGELAEEVRGALALGRDAHLAHDRARGVDDPRVDRRTTEVDADVERL